MYVSDQCTCCPSSHICQSLKMILTIVDRHGDDAFDREFVALHHRVLARLKESGWDYPSSRMECHQAGATGELRAMVDELARQWRQHMTATARKVGDMSPVEEEHTQD